MSAKLSERVPCCGPMTLAAFGPVFVDEGGGATFTAMGSDPDDGTLLYGLSGAPDGAVIDPVTGAVTLFAEDGPAYFDFFGSVTDPGGLSVNQPVHVEVRNVPPAATITGVPSVAVLPGTTLVMGSTVNDAAPSDTHVRLTVIHDGQTVASGSAATIAFAPGAVGDYLVTLDVADDDGGHASAATTVSVISSSLSGNVWEDVNNDGDVDIGESGIAVSIRLVGTDDLGGAVDRIVQTDADGVYLFLNLRPSTYSLSESQPAGYVDGIDHVGSLGGAAANNIFSQIAVHPNQDGINYNFGERRATAEPVARGQLPEIGFWQNKNGQDLIRELNGGATHTELGSWLASTMPNYFGAAGHNLAGATNATVAARFQQLFKLKGQKLDASVMAVALSAYVTTSRLAGDVAATYGFIVSATGVGASTWNVGNSGVAFGVTNGSTLRVLGLLAATNARTAGGALYGANDLLRKTAYSVFGGLLESGALL